MPKRKESEPRRGGSLVDVVFAKARLGKEARSWRALYAWHQLAGERLGRHARAERLWDDTLIIRVRTAAWANELSYLRATLLAELRRHPDLAHVNELRFTVGPLDELPDWDEELHPAAPPPPPKTRPPLDASALAEALSAVRDPELRAALAELVARSAPPAK